MSKVSALYHIVFNTKDRRMTIPMDRRRALYAYMHGILTNLSCGVLRINGIGNHVHLLINLPPTLCLSHVVATIKQSSSMWMSNNPDFPCFDGWGKEYFATTINAGDKENVIHYIMHQESHHLGVNFETEFRTEIEANGFEWNDYLLT